MASRRLAFHMLSSTPRRCRCFHACSAQKSRSRADVPDFGFVFDIDGVLLRSKDPLPKSRETLAYLTRSGIPFIFLTNGGGKSERERALDLTNKLGVPISEKMLVQSHTPFSDLEEYKDKTVLVVGGEADSCSKIAAGYGFQTVVTPGDILAAHAELWPFSRPFLDYYKRFAKPLPRPIDRENPSKSLKIDAIFVYNDPCDWGLDLSIILDLLLSSEGVMGTISSKNDDSALPNRGYLQDNQPPIFYSSADFWFAAKYHLPRLGQGGFRSALQGLWATCTGGAEAKVELPLKMFGKPHQAAFEFAEGRLQSRWKSFTADDVMTAAASLRRIYMVGDNPRSDILGGNVYKSVFGSEWSTILVKTGVYEGGSVVAKPAAIVEDVGEAVQWAIMQQKQGGQDPA